MDAENVFHGVREWSVSHVMQERCAACSHAIRRVNIVAVSQLIEDARHEMQRAQAVCEPRVLGALIGVKPQTELLDATQSLKFWCVDQANQQPSFVIIGAKADNVVNRIAINALSQVGRLPMIILWRSLSR